MRYFKTKAVIYLALLCLLNFYMDYVSYFYHTGSYEGLFQEGLAKVDSLRKESDDVEHVFALLSSSWGSEEFQLFVLVKQNAASVQFREIPKSGRSEWKEVELTAKQTNDFLNYIKSNRIDTMKNFYTVVDDGIEYLYVHASRWRTTKVYMNNPEVFLEVYPDGDGKYERLTVKFYELVGKVSIRDWLE